MSEVEIELPQLYEAQRRAIYAAARFVFIEASTKAGKTFGCLVWQLHQVLTIEGEHWWIAPVYSQAKMAFRRVKNMLRGWPHWTANETELTITFSNGSRWCFRSGEKPDNLYGEDVRSAVVDEASRMREESWTAIYSTLTATGGCARIIGNVKGRGNWFYKWSVRAKSGDHEHFAYFKLTAYDAISGGVLKQAIIDQAKNDLPDHVFRELYLAEVSEDGTNPFTMTAIDRAIMPCMSSLPPVAWGWDVAKKRDWTVGIALDKYGNMCRLVRFQRASYPEIQARIAEHTNAPALIDSTGVGDPTFDNVLHIAPHLNGVLDGYVFSPKSKQALMETLASAIQGDEIGIVDGPVRLELEQFEYEHTRTGVRYAAPEGYGMHDDCVCALALAVLAFKRNNPIIIEQHNESLQAEIELAKMLVNSRASKRESRGF